MIRKIRLMFLRWRMKRFMIKAERLKEIKHHEKVIRVMPLPMIKKGMKLFRLYVKLNKFADEKYKTRAVYKKGNNIIDKDILKKLNEEVN